MTEDGHPTITIAHREPLAQVSKMVRKSVENTIKNNSVLKVCKKLGISRSL